MTTMPEVPDTWASRDLLILKSIVARVETTGGADSTEVAADTGLDEQTIRRGVQALEGAGYFRTAWDGGGSFGVMDVSEKARRAVGAWPSPEALALRLVEAVEQGLAAATTEDERSRWRKLRDGMTGAGTAVLTNAAGSALGTAAIGGVGG